MSLSDAVVAKLNKMNRAAQDASLGTLLKGIGGLYPNAGTHTVTAGEATAGEAAIDTGMASASVFLVQVFRAGVNVLGDGVVTLAAGVLTVADGASTYSITEDDVINYVVF